MGHNYSGNHPRFSMASPLKDSRAKQIKNDTEDAIVDIKDGKTKDATYLADQAYNAAKNIGKALTPGAAMGHPGSSLKKGGEVMHGSVSGALKNVLGPDNPHSHNKTTGKVQGKNALKAKMKNDNDGGGMLAQDPGAAGRELLYNQTKASGVKKKVVHKGGY